MLLQVPSQPPPQTSKAGPALDPDLVSGGGWGSAKGSCTLSLTGVFPLSCLFFSPTLVNPSNLLPAGKGNAKINLTQFMATLCDGCFDTWRGWWEHRLWDARRPPSPGLGYRMIGKDAC